MTFGDGWHDSAVKDKQTRTFATMSRGARLAESLFYIKPERLGQMVEMGLIRAPGTVSLPPQVAGSLHQPVPAGRNSRRDSRGYRSLQGTGKQNDQGAQMVQPGSLLKAS